MNTGKIYKSKQAGNFTVIPNSIFENRELSLKAIGLLCYLLKLPPDWVINKTTLHRNIHNGKGRELVSNAFTELEEAGYIIKHIARGKTGTFTGYYYEFFDNCLRKTRTKGEEKEPPITGKPLTVKPITENPSLIKKEITNTVLNKIPLPKGKGLNKKNLTEKAKPDPYYKNFVDTFFDWYKYRNGGAPIFSGKDGKAMNQIIYFMRGQVKVKHPDINYEEEGKLAVSGFNWVLLRWEKLSSYHQQKINIYEMASVFNAIWDSLQNPQTQKNGSTINTSAGKTFIPD